MKKRNSFGFTLIEILVAMLLLSISLVLILQLFSGGLKALKKSDDYSRAVFLAKEKMEEALAINLFVGGDNASGLSDDGYEWSVSVSDEASDAEDSLSKVLPVSLFKIDVDVLWGTGKHKKHFNISTLKLAKLHK